MNERVSRLRQLSLDAKPSISAERAQLLTKFYKENEVVQEERRMRLESSPSGRLMDEFLSVAFKEHPYGHGLIGSQSDLKSFTRREGTAFWNRYYTARNMTRGNPCGTSFSLYVSARVRECHPTGSGLSPKYSSSSH